MVGGGDLWETDLWPDEAPTSPTPHGGCVAADWPSSRTVPVGAPLRESSPDRACGDHQQYARPFCLGDSESERRDDRPRPTVGDHYVCVCEHVDERHEQLDANIRREMPELARVDLVADGGDDVDGKGGQAPCWGVSVSWCPPTSSC